MVNLHFNYNSDLERHNQTKKHINNYNTQISNTININNGTYNEIHIHQNIVNMNINGFSETNLDVISYSYIENLLECEHQLLNIIKEFKESPEDIYGDSDYLICMFKFFIKIFAKLNFNLAYSENHNCHVYSFNASPTNNYIEYHLIEINNTNQQYYRKFIDYTTFIEEFINLMNRVNKRYYNDHVEYILNYIKRYKRMLLVKDGNVKYIIENELLTSYTEFEESRAKMNAENEAFQHALMTARNNAFKHLMN